MYFQCFWSQNNIVYHVKFRSIITKLDEDAMRNNSFTKNIDPFHFGNFIQFWILRIQCSECFAFIQWRKFNIGYFSTREKLISRSLSQKYLKKKKLSQHITGIRFLNISCNESVCDSTFSQTADLLLTITESEKIYYHLKVQIRNYQNTQQMFESETFHATAQSDTTQFHTQLICRFTKTEPE